MKYVFEIEHTGKKVFGETEIVGYGESYTEALKDAYSRSNKVDESAEVVDFYTVK